MRNKGKTTHLLFASFLLLFGFNSCTKDETGSKTDSQLYQLALKTDGYTWFKNTSDLLDRSSGSGHSQPFLRTRYNTIAASQLDSVGRIVTGAIFPEGSVIVKELYKTATEIGRYAILFKNSDSEDADANGWVWGYINADGNVVNPASGKGASCINCHSQPESIDYMLMNKFFQ